MAVNRTCDESIARAAYVPVSSLRAIFRGSELHFVIPVVDSTGLNAAHSPVEAENKAMQTILAILQIVAALGLLNVWLLRSRRQTPYRGGNATSIQEEFAAYGLPGWFVWVIGALKVGAAVLLIAGLWIPAVVVPTGLLICVLMFGALSMHVKIGDPLKKSMPALLMLAISIAIVLIAMRK